MQERFSFRAGQFGLSSAFGEGESTFCIASPPTWRDHLECTFRAVLEQWGPPWENGIAFVCGPPVMIRLSTRVLEKLGFTAPRIYTTLENRMKCGIGKCGRCNIGGTYVCKEGPVFTAADLAALPLGSDY
jgi:NAD(P)H-flavin reductase